MAASKEAGPVGRLVAANLRRIRQERGLGFAELARRTDVTGHHIADTALLKTENGTRKATIDDLAALAVALRVSPSRLLLPGIDDEPPSGGELPPWGKEPPAALWAWATGEIPLGRPAASRTAGRERAEELAGIRENRPHQWNAPPPAAPPSPEAAVAQSYALHSLNVATSAAFAAGLTTADIRAAVEGALMAALVNPVPSGEPPRVEITGDRVIIYTGQPGPRGKQEVD